MQEPPEEELFTLLLCFFVFFLVVVVVHKEISPATTIDVALQIRSVAGESYTTHVWCSLDSPTEHDFLVMSATEVETGRGG